MLSFQTQFRYGDAPHEVTVFVHNNLDDGDTSGIYAKLHVPKSENPAKTWTKDLQTPVPVETEIIFDRDDNRCLLEVNVTAGATEDPITVEVNADSKPYSVPGVTGTTVALTWPQGTANASAPIPDTTPQPSKPASPAPAPADHA